MTDQALSGSISRAAEFFRNADHAVAFTGAGISTPSGIPDFRSAGTGLWELHDPMQSASLSSFLHTPQRFYNWLRPLASDIVQADPNPAHLALAQLETKGRLSGVITQNIDNLHQRAGSQTVIELHGNLRRADCTQCRKTYPAEDLIIEFTDSGTIPFCPECSKRLKPAVVLFEEGLPQDAVQNALDLLSRADLVLVAGSSLQVSPASYFPLEALDNGAKLIMINLDPTYLDDRASVLFHADVAEVLPAIVKEVLGGR